MTKRKKLIISAAAFLAAAVIVLFLLQALLVPKYMSSPYLEGGLVREYYDSDEKHDVIFLGDCEFYECINPVVMWREYGISSYVRGSSQQLIWDSYYYLLETLQYETPKAVVFNAVEMKFGSVQHEEYTRLTLDGMRLSKYKLAAARESLTDGETLASYVFPILRYHSRWSELSAEDVKYMFSHDLIGFNGYMLMTGVKEKTSSVEPRKLADYTFSDRCWQYLDLMREVCEENGIEFIIMKAPTDTWHYPWYGEWETQLQQYASENGVRYINTIALADEIGTDWTTDSYDGGDHLNYIGAEKVSRYLGGLLSSEYGIPDRRSDPEYSAPWAKTCERFDAALAAALGAEG